MTVALCLLAPTARARATEGAPELAVSRAAALRMGAENGPSVREARAPAAAAPLVRDATGGVVSYVPRVTAFGGRREGGFGSGLELGGGVAQDLSVRGLGDARRHAADAVTQAAHTTVERARLEGAGMAVLAWLDVIEAQQLLALRVTSRNDAIEIERVATARAARGVSLPIEVSLAAAEVGAAQLAEQDAEGRVVEARAALKYALGLPPSPDVVATGELDAEDAEAAPAPARRDHPAAAEARAHAALAEADARLVRAIATPPLTVGLNYAREGTGEQYLTATVTFPLPLLDPSRFDAARQRGNVLTAEARAVRVRAELARDDALTLHDRAHTREVRDTLRTRVIGPLGEAVRLARASYQSGTQDATSLLLLRQRLVAVQEQLGHAVAEVQRADVRSAVARGTLLDGTSR